MKSAETNLPLETFSELVGAIYDGLLETVPWQKILSRMRSELGANYVTLILRSPRPGDHGLMVNVGAVTSEGTISYHSHYYAMDPFVGLPSEKVVTTSEIMGEARWVASPFYQEFLAPYDIHHLMGADIRTADGGECRLRVCRPLNAPDFSDRDKAFCTLLLPHFKRAVHLHGQLEDRKSTRLNSSHIQKSRMPSSA